MNRSAFVLFVSIVTITLLLIDARSVFATGFVRPMIGEGVMVKEFCLVELTV